MARKDFPCIFWNFWLHGIDGVFSFRSDNQDIRFFFASSFPHSPLILLPFYWIRAILLRLNRCILGLNTICLALLEPQISFFLSLSDSFQPNVDAICAFAENSRLLPGLRFTPNFHSDNLNGALRAKSCTHAHHKFNSINRTLVGNAHRAHHNN